MQFETELDLGCPLKSTHSWIHCSMISQTEKSHSTSEFCNKIKTRSSLKLYTQTIIESKILCESCLCLHKEVLGYNHDEEKREDEKLHKQSYRLEKVKKKKL